jgi:uncharacterized small protein (DUF1192 family)
LGYDEREYRENIERRKLWIEYYQRTGQFDKATSWEAQLGKSLERHQRANVPVARKKLEGQYLALRQKLDLEMEAEFEWMTDEELNRLSEEDGQTSDDCEDSESETIDVNAMSVGELKDRIQAMKEELRRYAALPSQAPAPAALATHPAGVEIEPERDDAEDEPTLPVYKRKVGADWKEIEAEAMRARPAQIEAEPEDREANAVMTQTAEMAALKKAFRDYQPATFTPGRRDPFY